MYTMHSAKGDVLGEEFMHELVHKNHITQPHTRRTQEHMKMAQLEDFFTGTDSWGGGFGVGNIVDVERAKGKVQKAKEDAEDEQLQASVSEEVVKATCEMCSCLSCSEGRSVSAPPTRDISLFFLISRLIFPHAQVYYLTCTLHCYMCGNHLFYSCRM